MRYDNALIEAALDSGRIVACAAPHRSVVRPRRTTLRSSRSTNFGADGFAAAIRLAIEHDALRAPAAAPIFAPGGRARDSVRRDASAACGVGRFPTVKAILAGRLAPGLVDRYLAWAGYSGQLTSEPASPDAPGNLFEPVAGNWGAEGRFVNLERHQSWQMLATQHRGSAAGLLLAIGWLGILVG